MGGLTEERPKCMVELGGRPLLEWQAAALGIAGVKDIAIVTGWCKELLEARIATTFHNPRWKETNMVTSLVCAESWLEAGPCIVSYSDIFFPSSAVSALDACGADIAVTYDPEWLALWSRRFIDPLSDAETFQTDASGKVIEIGGRATSLDQVKGQFMGLLRFTPAGWRVVTAYLDTLNPAARDKMDTTLLMRGLISRGATIKGVAISGRWGEADSADDILLYEEDYRQRLIKFPGYQ
jgi:L-glutamine-phosphate cytidylyltransferase